MDWIDIMQDRGEGRDLANNTLHVQDPKRASNFLSKDCAALN